MDALPHRGLYKGFELTQETGGIAATLPWDYEVRREADALTLRCWVQLPVFPLYVEKEFRLGEGESGLRIRERVTHRGDAPMEFTWTQHAMFGGELVDECTRIFVPAGQVFDAWAHAAAPERGIAPFRFPAGAALLKYGRVDLSCPLPDSHAGSEFVVYQDLKEGRVVLRSPQKKLSAILRWDLARFPYLRSLYQTQGGYIVGLEPGNDSFSGLEHSRRYGTLTTMQPGETIETCFFLEFAEKSGD